MPKILIAENYKYSRTAMLKVMRDRCEDPAGPLLDDHEVAMHALRALFTYSKPETRKEMAKWVADEMEL